MDRTQAFVEYGHILEDASDWLSSGYRRSHENHDIVLPAGNRISGITVGTSGDTRNGSEGPKSLNSPIPPEKAVPPAAQNSPGSPGTADTRDAAGYLETTNRYSDAAEPDPSAVSELLDISREISTCRNCNLYLIRQKTVPGIGRPGATLMIITPPPADGAGEQDGPLPAYEREYLEKWLTALNLNPGTDTFITPAVKCRTPGGRPPHPDESTACSGYLRRQYKIIRPGAILALGAAACGALTGNSADFPSLVGREWTWGSVPALVLWTPAEVLTNPGRLRKPVWDSLQRLKAAWNAVPGSRI